VVAGTRGDRLDPDGRTLTVYRPYGRSQITPVAEAAQQQGAGFNSFGRDASQGRTVPSAPSGPRAVADASHGALPAREIRTRAEESSVLSDPSEVQPGAVHERGTRDPGQAVSFPGGPHAILPARNMPERPQRVTRPTHETVRTEGEKYPPRSLVV